MTDKELARKLICQLRPLAKKARADEARAARFRLYAKAIMLRTDRFAYMRVIDLIQHSV